MITDNNRYLYNGVIGTITPILGLITSFQEQLEWGMRIFSLGIGIVVGIVSLVKFFKNR